MKMKFLDMYPKKKPKISAKTLIIHPATTTHSRIDAEALIAAGITEDMVRISVGIEDVSDIQDDFNKGFRAAKKFC